MPPPPPRRRRKAASGAGFSPSSAQLLFFFAMGNANATLSKTTGFFGKSRSPRRGPDPVAISLQSSTSPAEVEAPLHRQHSVPAEEMARTMGLEIQPPDFDTAERECVCATWKAVGERISEIGLSAFLKMFRRSPETLMLFPMLKHLSKEDLEFDATLKSHTIRLTGMLTMLVAQLEHDSTDSECAIANLLSELGVRHFGYGARPDQMELLGYAFVDTLMPIFENDPAYTQIYAAWNAFFALIVFWMQVGFRFVQSKGGKTRAH